MCKTNMSDQVERCFNMACPLDQAIIKAERVEGLDLQVSRLTRAGDIATEELARLQQRVDYANRKWDTVKTGLQELIDDGTITGDGLLEEFLLEEFDIQITDEVTVTVNVEVTVTVSKPRGEELTHTDFWFDTEPHLDCNYEILDQSACIEDVTGY